MLGGVKGVQLGAKSIRLEKSVEGFGSEIPFEYAVIATVSLKGLFEPHPSDLGADSLFSHPTLHS